MRRLTWVLRPRDLLPMRGVVHSAIIELEDVLHIAEAVAEPVLLPVGMVLDEGLKLLAVLVCGAWEAVFDWRTLDVC